MCMTRSRHVRCSSHLLCSKPVIPFSAERHDPWSWSPNHTKSGDDGVIRIGTIRAEWYSASANYRMSSVRHCRSHSGTGHRMTTTTMKTPSQHNNQPCTHYWRAEQAKKSEGELFTKFNLLIEEAQSLCSVA